MKCFLGVSFPKEFQAPLTMAYISSSVVSLRCVICQRYLNYVPFSNIFPDQLVYIHSLRGLSCISPFPCVFLGQLSDFLRSDCLKVIPFAWVFG